MDRLSQTLHVIYQTLLIIGQVGVLAQAVLGFAHGHGGHDQGGHGGHDGAHHMGGAHGHEAAGAAGHAHHAHGGEHAAHHGENEANGAGRSNSSGGGLSPLWGLFSPLTLFSLCLGAGAAGLVALLYLAPAWTMPVAALGGAGLYRLVVRPLWALIFQFASRPSRALEGTVAGSAEALTRFDARGQGMVRLIIDGQIVRILARLEDDERAEAAAVRPGDTLTVTQVDARANTCRVARLS